LAVLCLAATIVGWHVFEDRSPTVAESVSTPSPARSQPSAAEAQQETAPAARNVIDTRSPAGPGVENHTSLSENPNCSVTRQYFDPRTGDLRDVYACTSPEESGPHPYEDWSDETLANLAYGDAKAAEVLGLRNVVSGDPNQEALGLNLLYRSVALSGDLDTFRKAIGRRYAYVSYNGKPLIHNLKQLLVFNVIGGILGDERFDPAPIEKQLRNLEVPTEELDRIHRATSNILTSMAQLQTEMTGDTTISEALANA
jgi:hypothetical protein